MPTDVYTDMSQQPLSLRDLEALDKLEANAHSGRHGQIETAGDDDNDDDDVSTLTEPGESDLLPEELMASRWFEAYLRECRLHTFEAGLIFGEEGVRGWLEERMREEEKRRDLVENLESDGILRQRVQSFLMFLQWWAAIEQELSGKWSLASNRFDLHQLDEMIETWERVSADGGRAGIVERLAEQCTASPPEVVPPWTLEEVERGDDLAFKRRLGMVLHRHLWRLISQMKVLLDDLEEEWELERSETEDSYDDDDAAWKGSHWPGSVDGIAGGLPRR